MKRNIFSVLLVCLMIVSVCVLSGCKVDELEAQVNENASAAEGAVSDAISKAEDAVDAAAKEAAANLAAAQEELEKLIADGAQVILCSHLGKVKEQSDLEKNIVFHFIYLSCKRFRNHLSLCMQL